MTHMTQRTHISPMIPRLSPRIPTFRKIIRKRGAHSMRISRYTQ